MGSMDRWDWTILAVAAYVAVVALSRLMIQRRDTLIAKFRADVEQEKQRQKMAKKKAASAASAARNNAA